GPAAVRTKDGVTYTLVTNPDGTPVAVDAGDYVALFTTGTRFASATPTVTIGGTDAVVTYSGAQGMFVGSDQVNFIVPPSLGGKGPVDLVIKAEGRESNIVKMNVK